jgi:magnesium chelatase family protein
VVVPLANAREAALVPHVTVRAADTLRVLIDFVRGSGALLDPPPAAAPAPPGGPDLSDVAGQELGRRALELAAAGGHHLLLVGPPGTGKSMLAQRLPSILPPLSDEEALEVTAVHSVAGALPPGTGLLRRPPFQAPHHSASVAALVGGGSGLAKPGASRWRTGMSSSPAPAAARATRPSSSSSSRPTRARARSRRATRTASAPRRCAAGTWAGSPAR